MRKLFFYLALLTIFVTNFSFGACYHKSRPTIFQLDVISSGSPSCFECPSVYKTSTTFYYNPKTRLGVGQVEFSPCNQTAVDNYCSSHGAYDCSCGNAVLCSRQCHYSDYCTTQTEADSVVMEFYGNLVKMNLAFNG